jgi:hypothetical protein
MTTETTENEEKFDEEAFYKEIESERNEILQALTSKIRTSLYRSKIRKCDQLTILLSLSLQIIGSQYANIYNALDLNKIEGAEKEFEDLIYKNIIKKMRLLSTKTGYFGNTGEN